MLTFSIIERDPIIILRVMYICLMHIAYWKLLNVHNNLHNTYCHVLFLFTLLIYLYHLSDIFRNWLFAVNQMTWIRTKARTAELASKYIKRLSDINYRTRTFELRPRDHRRGTQAGVVIDHSCYMPQIISLAVYDLGRRFCPALLSHSAIWTLMLKQYWYLIRAKPQDRTVRYLIWIGYLRPFTFTDENWETRQSLL